MKRILTLIIFTVLATSLTGQWIRDGNIEGKCSHVNLLNHKQVFNPDYNWQSDYLFDYDVVSYFIDIEVSDTTTYIEGDATINCIALVSIDTFAFELIPEQIIEKIIINEIEYNNFYREEDNVLVPVNEIPEGTYISAQIYYHGKPPVGTFFSGITNDSANYWQKRVTWTLSEPFAAKYWFPVKQDLQDKADSAWIFLTTASTNMAGSEGLLTAVVDLGNGKSRYEWKTYYPIDYYLLSFAVSEYQDYSFYAHPVEMGDDSLLIQNFIYDSPGNLEDKTEKLALTDDIIELFSDLFSLYPFHEEKYGHCQTQLGGGMEHQTMSTMGYFGFHLIAHEMGHMWFGDNVTCATWSDIWINEGFATYSDYLATEFIEGWEAGKEFMIKTQEHAMTLTEGSVYIPEDEVYPGNEHRIFSGELSYDKGAAIIHMLRHEIQNDDQFFDVLRSFQASFAGATATGDDFRETAENITGIDLNLFFEQWYYGDGYPRFNLKYWTDEQNTFYLSSTQTTTTSQTTLFDMLIDFRLHFADGTDTLIKFRQTDNLNVFSMGFDEEVVDVEFDPEQWTMEEVISISNIDESGLSDAYFSIGPIPVLNKLNVYFLNEDSKPRIITITNIAGQLIYSGETTESHYEIVTTSFKSGIYTISVTAADNIITKKFVK